MADFTSYIGGTLSFAVATRDPDADESAYGAESYTELGNVKTIGQLGDTSSAINFSLLKEGRVSKVNGEKDGGNIAVAVAYDASDSSYTTLRAKSNTNDTVWFDVEDVDGEHVYFQGLVADWQDTERNTTTEKGATFTIRVTTGYVYSTA